MLWCFNLFLYSVALNSLLCVNQVRARHERYCLFACFSLSPHVADIVMQKWRKRKGGALRNEENRAVEECFQWRRRSIRVGRGDAGVVPPDLHWAKSTNSGAALTSSVTPTSFDTVHPSVLLHPAWERKCWRVNSCRTSAGCCSYAVVAFHLHWESALFCYCVNFTCKVY